MWWLGAKSVYLKRGLATSRQAGKQAGRQADQGRLRKVVTHQLARVALSCCSSTLPLLLQCLPSAQPPRDKVRALHLHLQVCEGIICSPPPPPPLSLFAPTSLPPPLPVSPSLPPSPLASSLSYEVARPKSTIDWSWGVVYYGRWQKDCGNAVPVFFPSTILLPEVLAFIGDLSQTLHALMVAFIGCLYLETQYKRKVRQAKAIGGVFVGGIGCHHEYVYRNAVVK